MSEVPTVMRCLSTFHAGTTPPWHIRSINKWSNGTVSNGSSVVNAERKNGNLRHNKGTHQGGLERQRNPSPVRTRSVVRITRWDALSSRWRWNVSGAAGRGRIIACSAFWFGQITFAEPDCGLDVRNSARWWWKARTWLRSSSQELAQYRRHTVGMVFKSLTG